MFRVTLQRLYTESCFTSSRYDSVSAAFSLGRSGKRPRKCRSLSRRERRIFESLCALTSPLFRRGIFLGFSFSLLAATIEKGKYFALSQFSQVREASKPSTQQTSHMSVTFSPSLSPKEGTEAHWLSDTCIVYPYASWPFHKEQVVSDVFPAFDSDGKTTRMLGKEGQESDGNYAEFLVAVRRVRCAHF